MNDDLLKSAWQGMVGEPKSDATIKNMMQERAHPLLRRIRIQLIIEIAAFTVFLIVYYDFFDGDRKPLYANVILVMGLLFVITHNLIGYIVNRRSVTGNTIKQSLARHVARIKNFAIVSVSTRVLAAACLLLFFTSTVTLTENKRWILAVIILIFIIQIALLLRIWIKRIDALKGTVNDFNE
ncbi:hypothetical protein [Niastella populi]|uniref:Uncharacterized protein n=1 Tax=Niastella populi TaxID=550983 RepID=A0A1V9F2H9_9BACT|nr:hypothetical protein [Niastella populi]OQP52496.1 hypothetical protein A4R26_28775 [Niastella populi]